MKTLLWTVHMSNAKSMLEYYLERSVMPISLTVMYLGLFMPN